MSEERLNKMAGGNRGDLAKLPKEINGKLRDFEIKEDSRKNECLYLDIEQSIKNAIETGYPEAEELTEPLLWTQKYSAGHIKDILGAMKELGYENLKDMIGKTYFWKKKTYTMGNPRLIPQKEI